jgi:acetolactate synthase-1/2/3 large subunit
VAARERHVLLFSCLGEDTGGGLFAYDGTTVEQIDELSSTGLALAGDRLGRLLWSSGEGGSVGELLVYDSDGVERYVRLDSLREPHDLAWHERHFVAVSSRSNSLLWISSAGEVMREWHAGGEGDAWHLNSLLSVDDRLVATAFGRFDKHREWTDGRATGRGILFDVDTGEDIFAGLSCPHDPRLADGTWLICNSGTRELLAIDAESSRIVHRVPLNGWTRGIGVCGDLLYVGESAHRTDAEPGDLAAVAVVDRRTWSVVERIPLPCQDIFDVLPVSAALIPGIRRGFRTNPLRTAELDQHALFRAVGVQPARLWATGEPLPPAACRVTLDVTLPEQVISETLYEIDCVVANEGHAILVSAPPNPVHISYRWFRGEEVLEGDRSILPSALPPGAALPCRLTLRTPPHPDDYVLVITLVQEGVAWFDELHPQNAVCTTVQVTHPETTSL